MHLALDSIKQRPNDRTMSFPRLSVENAICWTVSVLHSDDMPETSVQRSLEAYGFSSGRAATIVLWAKRHIAAAYELRPRRSKRGIFQKSR